jgi:hypothetical protein
MFFLSRTPAAQKLKEIMGKRDYMKLNGLQIEDSTHRVGENIC